MPFHIGVLSWPVDFSPAKLSNLIVWYDATTIIGVAGGAALSSWPDRSGNGRPALQATSNNQPFYEAAGSGIGANPAVLFGHSVANARMATNVAAGLNQSQPFSVAAIIKPDVTTSLGVCGLLAGGVSGFILGSGINISSTIWEAAAGSGLDIVGGTPDTSAHLLIGIYNGASSLLVLDGAVIASGNVGPNVWTFAQFSVGYADYGAVYFSGLIGEAFASGTAWGTTDLANIHRYSQSKWATP